MKADVYLPKSYSKPFMKMNGEIVHPESYPEYWLIKNISSGEYFLTDLNSEKLK